MSDDRVTLRRVMVISFEDLRAGEYVQIHRNDEHNKWLWAVLCCPVCGRTSSLSRAVHDVDCLGDVTPQSSCPHNCGQHGRLWLGDWRPTPRGDA